MMEEGEEKTIHKKYQKKRRESNISVAAAAAVPSANIATNYPCHQLPTIFLICNNMKNVFLPPDRPPNISSQRDIT